MTTQRSSFDRLARVYRVLEYLAFGRDLERARFCYLEQLGDCREILVLGEGDGRCLARLVTIAPTAHIHCIDASPAMLDRAGRRLSAADQARVTFSCVDARALELPTAKYDAVTTFFFLDCFTTTEVRSMVHRIRNSLCPRAIWLFADFALPARGWARWRARLWLGILYAFFRWQTGLTARALPDAEPTIEAAGFVPVLASEFQQGLLRSRVYCNKT
jgi:ubiquinone/menaquinone biosynthesis C-methylase UbiE